MTGPTPRRRRSPSIKASSVQPPMRVPDALEKLIGTPELCSKRWVWEQYDHVILGNTVQRPGGDAAVVRVNDGPKALALTVDVTPRYCEADPFEGGKQAVAEAWRNITAVGGTPLAITDNLNFGNPEKPEIMGQFVGCVRGIAEACKALDFPVVSGNVSLYNETQGRGILPTPSIGGVGVLSDFTKSATLAFKAADEAILLIGETQGWLGQSLYLRDICGREEGAPPPVDLIEERENGDVVRALIADGLVTAAHDLSDGGLLVAVAEMAMASGIGADAGRGARRHAGPRLLVRRGPGALSGDGAGRPRRGGDAARAGGQRAGAPDRLDRRRRHRHSGRTRHRHQDAGRALRGLAAGLYGRAGLMSDQGSSEKTTINARLSAEAMSRAVSSMSLSYRCGRLFPNAEHAVWMPNLVHSAETEYRKRCRPEFGIISV